MPAPAPVPRSPSLDPPVLARLAELLLHAGDPLERPLVVWLRAADDGIELTAEPVDDVVAELFGVTTPPHWHGLGVVVAGRARSLEPDPDGTPSGSVIGRALSSLVVWRDGAAASALSIDGSAPRVQVDHVDRAGGTECAGRIVDVVRRALGLPTAAPSAHPHDLTIALWLHRVHTSALGDTGVDRTTIDTQIGRAHV